MNGQLATSDPDEGCGCGRGAGHVALHPFHAIGWLDRQPAAVKGHPFSNECKRCMVSTFVGEYHQPGRTDRSLPNRQQAAAVLLFQTFFVPDFDLDIQTGHLLLDSGDKRLGIHGGWWLVDP